MFHGCSCKTAVYIDQYVQNMLLNLQALAKSALVKGGLVLGAIDDQKEVFWNIRGVEMLS